MPPDPYDILGVPKNASTTAIKSAFNRLAKVRHPDHGGDPELFRSARLAYDVLSDPEHRSHYDQTGETPDAKAAREAEEAYLRTMLGDLFVSVVSQAAAPQFTDIAELVRAAIAQHIAKIDQQLAGLSMLIERLAETHRRLHSLSGSGFVADALAHRESELLANISSGKLQRARWLRLQEMVRDYVYDVQVESVP